MLTIVNGVTSKQVLAKEIINLLETMGLDGYCYLGYPVLGGIDGKIKVDALLVRFAALAVSMAVLPPPITTTFLPSATLPPVALKSLKNFRALMVSLL